ncbi:hypothetical protein BAE44_0018078 [Dichanthelium oligosanthes]|uniref:Uncharacterized protein n=1 Tax=Dichanthelium oligosanthes TaxID=888268 RepID=A0A1E5V6W5_9POAL|nr:hypothetical protein BAE44_0018078 [Dichanthelium oligosanthes]
MCPTGFNNLFEYQQAFPQYLERGIVLLPTPPIPQWSINNFPHTSIVKTCSCYFSTNIIQLGPKSIPIINGPIACTPA